MRFEVGHISRILNIDQRAAARILIALEKSVRRPELLRYMRKDIVTHFLTGLALIEETEVNVNLNQDSELDTTEPR